MIKMKTLKALKTLKTAAATLLTILVPPGLVAVTPERFTPSDASPYYRIQYYGDPPPSVNNGRSLNYYGVRQGPGFVTTAATDLNQWWKLVRVDAGAYASNPVYLIYSVATRLTEAMNNKGECIPAAEVLADWHAVRIWKDAESGLYAMKLCGTSVPNNCLYNPKIENLKHFTAECLEPPTVNYKLNFEAIDLDFELATVVETLAAYDGVIVDESLRASILQAMQEAEDASTADEKVAAIRTLLPLVEDARAQQAAAGLDPATAPASAIRITAESGLIRVAFPGTATVTVHTSDGRLLDCATATGSYRAPVNAGIYLISVKPGVDGRLSESVNRRKLIVP
jgi:hypothetical protein